MNNIHNQYISNISLILHNKPTDSKDKESSLFDSVSQENDIPTMAVELKINRGFFMRLIETMYALISDNYAKHLEERLDFAEKFVSMVLKHAVLSKQKQKLISYIDEFPDSFNIMLSEKFKSWCMNPPKDGENEANEYRKIASDLIKNYNSRTLYEKNHFSNPSNVKSSVNSTTILNQLNQVEVNKWVTLTEFIKNKDILLKHINLYKKGFDSYVKTVEPNKQFEENRLTSEKSWSNDDVNLFIGFYFQDTDIEQCKNILESVNKIHHELNLVVDPYVLEEKLKSDLGLKGVEDLRIRLEDLQVAIIEAKGPFE